MEGEPDIKTVMPKKDGIDKLTVPTDDVGRKISNFIWIRNLPMTLSALKILEEDAEDDSIKAGIKN